ncbi:unnamed protein product [Rotaria sp. Silwood1]|nr:unnamed protein product [Rotaria sp. Silwood1]
MLSNIRTLRIIVGSFLGLVFIFFMVSNFVPTWSKIKINNVEFTSGLWRSCSLNENTTECFDLPCSLNYAESNISLTSLNDSSCSINNDIILDRVSQILPSIHHKIQCIGLDASIIEQILFSTTYPNLKTLVLYVTSSTAINLSDDNSLLFQNVGPKIQTLIIKTKSITREIHVLDLERADEMLESMKMPQVLFKQSCIMFTNLQYVKFGSTVEQEQLGFDNIDSVSFSSNISKLNIEVDTFNDCLFLLDVKFDRLTHLYVRIYSFHDLYSLNHMHKSDKMSNLTCFSITYMNNLYDRDKNGLLNLLRRMPNLNELYLEFLMVSHSIVDGSILSTRFINAMSNLNKFTFNIGSLAEIDDKRKLPIPTNEDIKNSFKNFLNTILSSIHQGVGVVAVLL